MQPAEQQNGNERNLIVNIIKSKTLEVTQLFVLLQGWNSHSYLIATFLRPESSDVIFLWSTFPITCFHKTLRFVEFRINE